MIINVFILIFLANLVRLSYIGIGMQKAMIMRKDKRLISKIFISDYRHYSEKINVLYCVITKKLI